ncbi:MAG: heavy-metal-associated domain-containing protein [Ruminococcus sp.]|nr:heavy-metal-associated domain-containing protein [Ruminococcus sp.]
MVKLTLGIEGMACGMCEAHINDAVRNAFAVKKVVSSHKKKQTVIIAEREISERELESAVKNAGYELISVSCEPYEKKSLFGAVKG